MTLMLILLATLIAGGLSVLLAATVSLTWLHRFADRMLAYAVGVLLAFAFTKLMPEAVHLGLDPHLAGQWLLAGVVAFFLLEKAALWRHAHHGHDHAHHPELTRPAAGPGSGSPRVTMIVVGDGMHNFVDGVLIAAAFLVDPALGWATTAAILAHELPQEIGDFMALLAAGVSRVRALALNALSSASMVLGGVLAYFVLDDMEAVVPYVLVLAAASFIYIAVADLVPELRRQRRFKDAAGQLALLLLGVATVQVVGLFAHHSH